VHLAFQRALRPQMSSWTLVDHKIVLLSCAAYEDFKELVVLCNMGYGLGSQKQLRCLYEKVLSAAYLSVEPDKVNRFHKYYAVHHHKVREAALKIYNFDDLEKAGYNADMEELYKEVKDEFIANPTGTGRKRVSQSWGPPVEQMAGRVGGVLEGAYLYWYLMPTILIHPSQFGLLSYCDRETVKDPSGGLLFDPECQEGLLAFSLDCGHRLAVHLLTMLDSHFNLKLGPILETCTNDLKTCWDKRHD